jgi:hypothetical protein
LAGCESDAKSINDLLIKKLHVPSSNIALLLSEDATREAIISTFQSHLIGNNEIQTDDAMVFFYAGHGSRIEAPKGWVTGGNQIETICPHDERTMLGKGDLIFGIPDRTINGLLRKLASIKGDNIVRLVLSLSFLLLLTVSFSLTRL